MKKIFTLFAASLLALGASATEMVQKTAVLYWNNGTIGNAEVEGVAGTNNSLTYENGFSIVLERTDKSYSSAKAIEVNGENMTTIKLSNGATNTLHAPEGCLINKVALYSYINYNRVDKGSEGRVCYWKQIGDNTYTEETATILTDYLDNADYATNPDKVEVEIAEKSSIQFVNTGEQLCFVLEVSYLEPDPTTGVSDVAVEADGEAVYYNLNGVKVANPENGLFIKVQGGKASKVLVK